jgi:hypothetical protein
MAKWLMLPRRCNYSSAEALDMDDIPDLQAIDDVADPSVRFYAIIGACITSVSCVEHALFRCYVAASGLSEKDAAEVYYRRTQFTYKRDIVDGAVREALVNHSALPRWQEMVRRAEELLGPQGTRNLLGHNVVGTEYFVEDHDPSEEIKILVDHHVSQNPAVVSAGIRPERREEYDSLVVYARKVIGLGLSLSNWPYSIRKACGRSLPSDAPVLAALRPRRTKGKSPPSEPDGDFNAIIADADPSPPVNR